MRALLALLAPLLLVSGSYAIAQRGTNTQTPSQTVAGLATERSTVNASVSVVTGGTFQQILPSIIGNAGVSRQSINIENNNRNNDNCLIFVGPMASATAATAILLLPGGSYSRYWPFVPSDQISGTCANNGDSIYADYN